MIMCAREGSWAWSTFPLGYTSLRGKTRPPILPAVKCTRKPLGASCRPGRSRGNDFPAAPTQKSPGVAADTVLLDQRDELPRPSADFSTAVGAKRSRRPARVAVRRPVPDGRFGLRPDGSRSEFERCPPTQHWLLSVEPSATGWDRCPASAGRGGRWREVCPSPFRGESPR